MTLAEAGALDLAAFPPGARWRMWGVSYEFRGVVRSPKRWSIKLIVDGNSKLLREMSKDYEKFCRDLNSFATALVSGAWRTHARRGPGGAIIAPDEPGYIAAAVILQWKADPIICLLRHRFEGVLARRVLT